MREKTDRRDEATPDEKTTGEVRASPAQDRAGPLMDREHDGDERQDRDELQQADHGGHHALQRAAGEASEVAGRRLGHILRTGQAIGDRAASQALSDAVEGFLFSRCTSAVDTLAVVAVAHRLLVGQVGKSDFARTGEIVFDVETAQILDAMLATSVGALERITGRSASAFTGDGPAVN